MTNLITIELCAEDRARIDKLTDFLEKRIAQVDEIYLKNIENRVRFEMCEKEDERLMAEAEPAETTQPEETPTPKEEPAQEAETATEPSNKPTKATALQVTIEDIRSKVLELTGAGKRDEVRALVKAYADKVTDIPEGKRAEVLKKLTKLEG